MGGTYQKNVSAPNPNAGQTFTSSTLIPNAGKTALDPTFSAIQAPDVGQATQYYSPFGGGQVTNPRAILDAYTSHLPEITAALSPKYVYNTPAKVSVPVLGSTSALSSILNVGKLFNPISFF